MAKNLITKALMLSTASISFATMTQAESDLSVPSGIYRMDPNHATLTFKLNHLDLSTYVARFVSYSSHIDLNADNIGASSVSVDLDPKSIRADYVGDYHAIYPDSTYEGWDEHLARHENFFKADDFPEISFKSNAVELTGDKTGVVHGELTMLGQTLPLNMDVVFNGETASHPFIPGHAAVGFSASGTLKRSDFGMTFLLTPPFIGDEVTIEFEAEYLMKL